MLGRLFGRWMGRKIVRRMRKLSKAANKKVAEQKIPEVKMVIKEPKR